MFGRAVALQLLKRQDEAHAIYRRLQKRNGINIELLQNLVSTSPDAAAGEEYCRRLHEMDRHAAPALAGLAAAALGHREYEKALQLYTDLTAEAPDSHEAWFNLGVALQQSSRDSEAVDAYRRAIQIAPSSQQAYVNLGVALQRSGDLNGAVEAYRYAQKVAPQSPEPVWNEAQAWLAIGRVDFDRGDFPPAAEALYRSAELSPSAAGYANTGIAYYSAGQTQHAARAFELALGVDPACAEALKGLTVIAIENSDALRAVDCWRRLASCGVSDTDLAFNLGCLLQQAGDDEHAAEFYGAAVEAQPGFVDALVNLGHALEAQGRRDEAEKQWAKAMALPSTDR